MQDMVDEDCTFRQVPRFRRAGGVTDKVMEAFGQSEQMVFEEDEKATTANKCGMPVKSLKKMTSKTEPHYST